MKKIAAFTCLAFAFFCAPGLLFSQTEAVPTPEKKERTTGNFTVSGPAGVHISGPTTICKGGETILKAEGDYESFLWNTGANERFLRVREEGTYEVTVTTKGGCKLTTSVTVRVIPCT
ncbi:MAG: hypothetical protein SFV22_10015 [Saprospiraceae bacterium]|nr:hypothetical protein [Saprospiraceae bacterium]